MTRSHHDRTERRRHGCPGHALFAVFSCLALLGAPAFAAHHEGEGKPEHGSTDVVQVVSTNVQGKNVYIPSTIVVEAGRPTTLSIFNTTEIPHGFRIEGLDLEFILPSKEEYEVKVPALEAGKVYRIRCQLHPAHRSATLLVVGGHD